MVNHANYSSINCVNSTFEPSSAVNLPINSTFPASILTLAPLWNTQPSFLRSFGVMEMVTPKLRRTDFLSQYLLALARAVAVGRHLDVHALLRLGTLHAREIVVMHALHLLVAGDGGYGIRFF